MRVPKARCASNAFSTSRCIKQQGASRTAQQLKDDNMSNDQQASYALRKYKCHKEVHAGKITDMRDSPLGHFVPWGLEIVLDDNGRFTAPTEWVIKNNPAIGGYYVVYADGYAQLQPGQGIRGRLHADH